MNFSISHVYVLIATLILVGVFAFIATNTPDVEFNKDPTEQAWEMPTLTYTKANTNDKQMLARLNIWNAKVAAVIKAPTTQSWSLKGIIFESATPFALVLHSQKLIKYKVGDLLPNKELLSSISENSITYELNGKQTEKKLH